MTRFLKIYFLFIQEELYRRYNKIAKFFNLKRWETIYIPLKILELVVLYYVISIVLKISNNYNKNMVCLIFLLVYLLINLNLFYNVSVSKLQQKPEFELLYIYLPNKEIAFRMIFLYSYFSRQVEIVLIKFLIIILTLLHNMSGLLMFYVFIEVFLLLIYCLKYILNSNATSRIYFSFLFSRGCATLIIFFITKFVIQFLFDLRAVINKYKALKIPFDKILNSLDNITNNHFNRKYYYWIHKVEKLSNMVNNMLENNKTYIVAVIIEIAICFITFYILRKNISKSKRFFHYKKGRSINATVKNIFCFLFSRYTKPKIVNNNSLKAGFYKDICLFINYLKNLEPNKILECLFPYELFFAIGLSIAVAGTIQSFYVSVIIHFICIYLIMYGYIGTCNFMMEDLFKFNYDKKVSLALYCSEDFRFWDGLMIPKIKVLITFSALPILISSLLITLIFSYSLKLKTVFLLFNILIILITMKYAIIQRVKPYYLYFTRNIQHLLIYSEIENDESIMTIIKAPIAIVRYYLLFIPTGFLVVNTIFSLLRGMEWLYCYLTVCFCFISSLCIGVGKVDNYAKGRKVKSSYNKNF
ncbi:hypothetical protein [Anaerocellum danielii]|uniref:ABC transporter permease n=1 Tax=Anaerocellum danielii TaxID=1387557 RepID=A0ABZ0U4S3_9FIRM|nr:hypothetical protein [Caldicellulosiruptor danielii]WPX08720.1 hypothetical protein SOJ16_002629 [Caldicellulosiruptor danielii]